MNKDTTAATLSWFTYMLCKPPEVYEKVVEEVRMVTKHSTLEKMHYLHAALSDTLRLYLAVP